MRDILNYDKNNDDDGDGDEKKEKNTLNKSKNGLKKSPRIERLRQSEKENRTRCSLTKLARNQIKTFHISFSLVME